MCGILGGERAECQVRGVVRSELSPLKSRRESRQRLWLPAKSSKTANDVQKLFHRPTFRVYTSTDLLGVELGGALKNVIAIAAGAGDGLGFGDNSKAALVTRAIVGNSPPGSRLRRARRKPSPA